MPNLPSEIPVNRAAKYLKYLRGEGESEITELPSEIPVGQASKYLPYLRKMGRSGATASSSYAGSSSGASFGNETEYGELPSIKGGQITMRSGEPASWFKSGRHKGYDIAAPAGTAIPSVEEGEVVQVEKNQSGYGNSVVIKNSDGSFSRYAHLQNIGVGQGQKIKKGDVVGTIGNTGFVISQGGGGYHLHYERTK